MQEGLKSDELKDVQLWFEGVGEREGGKFKFILLEDERTSNDAGSVVWITTSSAMLNLMNKISEIPLTAKIIT